VVATVDTHPAEVRRAAGFQLVHYGLKPYVTDELAKS